MVLSEFMVILWNVKVMFWDCGDFMVIFFGIEATEIWRFSLDIPEIKHD